MGIFVLIAAGYVGGAALKARGQNGLGEAAYLVGCAAFGGGIALIGQMYHLSGDERAAILVWCFGTVLAAAALRSSSLTAASVVLSVAWLLTGICDGSAGPDRNFLPIALAIWCLSWWTRSIASRHLLLLSLVLYGALLAVDGDALTVGLWMALVSAIVFVAALTQPETVERFARLGGPAPAHPLIGFLVGIALVQVQLSEQFWPMLIASLIAFAGIVAALVLRGEQSRLMRWIAYAAFVLELCVLYVVTIGTTIETSALFLLSGVALGVVALFIARIERRLFSKEGRI